MGIYQEIISRISIDKGWSGDRKYCAITTDGGRIGDIGSTIQRYCEERGFSVVREFTGHGVGKQMHEDPSVPNFGTPGRGVRLLPGMTIAIEPMINMGGAGIRQLPDGWTIKTKDGALSAHFEHTVAITSNGPVILTQI